MNGTAVKNELRERIETALEIMRPFLKADGGDVEFVDVDDNMQVAIRLLGNCKDCSMSLMTMKAGIEDGIRKAVPQVKSVVSIA